MKFNQFFIGDKSIGEKSPCLIIAEVGLAHEGSLGIAHSFIDAVAQSGADAIKFQTHIAENESSLNEPFRVNIFPQDKNRYDYWVRTAFKEKEWLELKKHAEEKNLLFLSTPFSIEAANLLMRIGVKAWKVGSGETNNIMLLEKLSTFKLPILLSSGMSFIHELDYCIEFLKAKKIPTLLMQCISRYPCTPKDYGLNLITEFKKRYSIPIGYSDHSGELSTPLAAVSLGAKAIEMHVTWSKEYFGPDSTSSLTFDEFRTCIKGIRNIEESLFNPVKKDAVAKNLSEMRYLFTKGLIAAKNIKKGSYITSENIESRKPCKGISAFKYNSVIGKKALVDILRGEPIKENLIK